MSISASEFLENAQNAIPKVSVKPSIKNAEKEKSDAPESSGKNISVAKQSTPQRDPAEDNLAEPKKQTLEVSGVKKNAPAPKSEKQGKPHWEQLYELSKIKAESKEIIQKEKERMEDKMFHECTFKPNIHGEAKILQERNPLEVYKRNDDWIKQKEFKKKAMLEERQEKEMIQCSFKPTLNKNAEILAKEKNFAVSNQLGIERYLERQQLARQEKERVEKILNGNANTQVKPRVDINRGGYASKYIKVKGKEDEDIISVLRQNNFAQGALLLHNYLHSNEIKF